MSRKYMNERWCVRCGRCSPSPYLKKNLPILLNESNCDKNKTAIIVDIGCGNGRNSEHVKKNGHIAIPLDMANDYGEKIILGKQKFPIIGKHADIILCNYSLMFLDHKERKQVIAEIKRISGKGCTIMVELYPAKDSYAKTEDEMIKMQKEIFDSLGWEKIRYSKGKFIARKTT